MTAVATVAAWVIIAAALLIVVPAAVAVAVGDVRDAAETRRLYRQRRYDAWLCRQRRDEHAVVREAENALREGL